MEKSIYYGILNIGVDPSKIDSIKDKIEIIKDTYYKRDVKFSPYKNSKNKLVQLLLEEGFPTVREWNKIAKQEDYFSHISLEYITNCNWKELERKLITELRDILLRGYGWFIE